MPRRVHGSVLQSIQTLFNVGPVGGMADGQLVEQFLGRRGEGAEAAFTALVGIHGPMVWDVCCGILSDRHAAEDAFQATFLVLARRAGSIRRRDAVGPWLHGVARRIAIRARSAAGRRQPSEEKAVEMMSTPKPDPIRQEQVEALHEEVDRLAEKYRAPVLLCYFEGRTHVEAARLLKCPVGTISYRLSRARELLRARLTRRGLALPAVGAGAMLRPETASAAMPIGLGEATIKAAMNLAASKAMTAGMVPASITQLVQGEILTMTFTKLATVATGLAATGLLATAIGVFVVDGRATPLVQGAAAPAPSGGGQTAPSKPVPTTTAPARSDEDEKEARGKSSRNLLSLGLPLSNFAHDRNRFPAAAIRKDDKPLLSWRVALLPYLDEQVLYKKFQLDEPWDSPHNKALLDQMPAIYTPVAGKEKGSKRLTYYQVLVGPGALFAGDEGPRREDITDGADLTIMVVEGAKPVPWTKPEDIPFDKEKPVPDLGGLFEDGFHALMASGRVVFLAKNNTPEDLRAIITPDGGEAVNLERLELQP